MASRVPGGRSQVDFWIIAALFGYAMAQAIGRATLATSIELDSAEQVLLAQEYRWGYANQPPLYTWVQATVFQLCGTNSLALALVKATFLFVAYAFIYAAAKRITRSTPLSLLIVTSLVFIPQFAWELQRDLTHSAALVASVAATFYFFLRVLQTGRWTCYAALGCCFGLGILSKYNYALFPPALLLSSLSLPEYRAAWLRRRFLLTLVVAVALAAPHFAWLWQVREEVTSGLLGASPGNRAWIHRGKSLASLGQAFALFVLPLTVVYLTAARRGWAGGIKEVSKPIAQLLWRAIILGLAFCLAISLTAGTHFKDRLLLPVLLTLPLALGLTFGPRLEPRRQTSLTRLNIAAAIVLLFAAPAATMISVRMGRPDRISAPYGPIAAKLKEAGVSPDLILAENRWVGGNLKLHFPRSVVAVPELPVFSLRTQTTNCLLAWNAEKNKQPATAFHSWAEKISHLRFTNNPAYVEAPYRYAHLKFMRFGYMQPNLTQSQ